MKHWHFYNPLEMGETIICIKKWVTETQQCRCSEMFVCVCGEAQDPLQHGKDGDQSERWDFSRSRWEPQAAEAHSRQLTPLRFLFLSPRLCLTNWACQRNRLLLYMQNPLLSSLCLCIKFPFFNFSLLSFSPPAFVLFHLTIVLALFCISGSFFSLFISPPFCFSILCFFIFFYLTDLHFLSIHLPFSLSLRLVSPSQFVISAACHTYTHSV